MSFSRLNERRFDADFRHPWCVLRANANLFLRHDVVHANFYKFFKVASLLSQSFWALTVDQSTFVK